jgi:hypothetical protein
MAKSKKVRASRKHGGGGAVRIFGVAPVAVHGQNFARPIKTGLFIDKLLY